MLNYTFNDFEGIKVLELSGNLTSSSTELFKELVNNIVDKESIILNMENINFVTTSGLNALIDVSFNAKDSNRRLIILWPSVELVKMTEDLDMNHYLIFAESLEEGQIKIRFFT